MKNADSEMPPIDYSVLDELAPKRQKSSGPERQIPSDAFVLNLRNIPSYRQRLTGIGWLGLALLIICPAWLGMLYFQLIAARYSYQEPSAGLMLALAIGATVSPVMILVGREYYPTRTRPNS